MKILAPIDADGIGRRARPRASASIVSQLLQSLSATRNS